MIPVKQTFLDFCRLFFGGRKLEFVLCSGWPIRPVPGVFVSSFLRDRPFFTAESFNRIWQCKETLRVSI